MQTNPMQTCDVAVIGAGITGLTLAYRLQKAGLRVLVLEKRRHPGGVIRSEQQEGYLFDAGPNSTLDKGLYLAQLIRDLGLDSEMCVANDRAANRFIVKNGVLHKLPMSPPAFITSRLLSTRAKLRILGEMFVPRKSEVGNESVADFVQRRLGREFLTYVINPFVAGVYASDPAHLNVRAAFPKLKALEQQYGGLIRGAIAKQRQKRQNSQFAGPSGRLLSFRQGMQTLTSALADRLGSSLQIGIEVEHIQRQADGFTLVARATSGRPCTIRARRVVLACPAPVAAKLLNPLDKAAAAALERIPYAPVAVVFHGFPKSAVPHPLDGFGFLVPAIEKRRILGTIWSSTLFPGRAPAGAVALTTFVGGARQPELVHRSEDALEALVRQELGDLLGITGRPDFVRVMRWRKAIPQYTDAQPAAMAALEKLESAHPRLHVAGNFRGGISVADCVDNAFVLADTIQKHFYSSGDEHEQTASHSETAHPAAAPAP